MATFGQLGLGSGQSAAKDYSYLLDALSIKENQLASDGNLSPGDYKLLKGIAMQSYLHPGLTPQDRNKLGVKISEYDKNINVKSLNQTDDITRMKDDLNDDQANNSSILGANPALFAQANLHAIGSKLGKLSTAIDDANASGDEKSAASFQNEYNSTMSEFRNAQQALKDVQGSALNPGKPSGETVAYIKTNSKGEITDVSLGKVGDKGGYSETNGLYGGLKIYGKVNQSVDGKNTFRIGNSVFQGSATASFDPTNPGVIKPSILYASDPNNTDPMGNPAATPGVYKDVSLGLNTQSYVPDKGFAKNSKGDLYQNNGGKYTRYTGVIDPKSVGSTDENTIPISSSWEKNNIIPNVATTTDASVPFSPPMASTSNPSIQGMTPTGPAVPGATATPIGQPAPTGRPNTPAPISSAPTTSEGIAGSAMQSAGNWLSNLFKK